MCAHAPLEGRLVLARCLGRVLHHRWRLVVYRRVYFDSFACTLAPRIRRKRRRRGREEGRSARCRAEIIATGLHTIRAIAWMAQRVVNVGCWEATAHHANDCAAHFANLQLQKGAARNRDAHEASVRSFFALLSSAGATN